MDTNTLAEALERFARQDLAKARNSGHILTDTKLGNIDVKYDSATRRYTVRELKTGNVLSIGPAQQTREFLVKAYDVVLD